MWWSLSDLEQYGIALEAVLLGVGMNCRELEA
jgi:hypothetical protein